MQTEIPNGSMILCLNPSPSARLFFPDGRCIFASHNRLQLTSGCIYLSIVESRESKRTDTDNGSSTDGSPDAQSDRLLHQFGLWVKPRGTGHPYVTLFGSGEIPKSHHKDTCVPKIAIWLMEKDSCSITTAKLHVHHREDRGLTHFNFYCFVERHHNSIEYHPQQQSICCQAYLDSHRTNSRK